VSPAVWPRASRETARKASMYTNTRTQINADRIKGD
jgi:hypothetical protein